MSGRIAKAEPLPLAAVAPPVVVDGDASVAPPTRDELLAKLRSKRVEKRQGRSGKQVMMRTSEKALASAVTGLQNRLQKGTLSKDELSRFQEFNSILENCGNDVKLACRQYGVREDIIEDVVKASQMINSTSTDGVGKAVTSVMSAMRDKNVLPGGVITKSKK